MPGPLATERLGALQVTYLRDGKTCEKPVLETGFIPAKNLQIIDQKPIGAVQVKRFSNPLLERDSGSGPHLAQHTPLMGRLLAMLKLVGVAAAEGGRILGRRKPEATPLFMPFHHKSVCVGKSCEAAAATQSLQSLALVMTGRPLSNFFFLPSAA